MCDLGILLFCQRVEEKSRFKGTAHGIVEVASTSSTVSSSGVSSLQVPEACRADPKPWTDITYLSLCSITLRCVTKRDEAWNLMAEDEQTADSVVPKSLVGRSDARYC